MKSGTKAIGRMKVAAAQHLRWGALVAMAGAVIVAMGCDRLLFRFYPATGLMMASVVFVLASIFCCWPICAFAFERRRFLLRVAIHSARRRRGQRAPALADVRPVFTDRI